MDKKTAAARKAAQVAFIQARTERRNAELNYLIKLNRFVRVHRRLPQVVR